MNWIGWLVIILIILYVAFGFFLGSALGGISSAEITFAERLKFALTWPLMFLGR